MITYLILGITVVVSFICFGNQTLAMKLALSPYQVIDRNGIGSLPMDLYMPI